MDPLVEAAKKALTPEQLDEYKKIGEYMYNNIDYKNAILNNPVKNARHEDLVIYATEALKSGCDPHDLTKDELQAIEKHYGEKWYTQFDLDPENIPSTNPLDIDPSKLSKIIENKANSMKLSRQQRRVIERKLKKMRSQTE
jgi:hypothetical protein